MALTNLDKDTTNRLFKMLALNDNFDLEVIKKTIHHILNWKFLPIKLIIFNQRLKKL